MLAAWQVMVIAALAVVVIAAWVRRVHGTQAALVMLAFAGAALACVWVSFEEFPVEQWRHGSLLHGLALFSLPAAAAALVAVVRVRRGHAARGRFLLAGRSWLLLGCLWAGPALLLYVSQLAPFTGSDLSDISFANSAWWAGSSILIYVSIPVLYAAIARQRVRSYGLSLGFVRSEGVVIALIAPVMIVLVWLVSADERFQAVYPFYDYAHGGDGAIGKLLAFEALYGATFVALEFFFRGFLVFAGYPVLGIHAIPAMAFAYCLLHLGKPMPECASSLVGGLVLGYVALRVRSIAAGVVAHLTIAWGMDAFVISRA
ncbi:MAG: CPBP family glutamic-type intramembrane protease [Candidatus Nanopelagicales bacterium]